MYTKENFKFDVICPHLNYQGLYKSLTTLRKRTPKENLGKIILINQSGNDYPWAKELVDVHIQIENQGFARANNLGIRLSDAEFVACMNDDVEIIHPKWIDGIVETFNRYDTALCVSPASPRNPRASGAEPIDHPDFPYREEEWTEEEYDKLLTEVGKGHVIDGIAMFFPIFKREFLEKVKGTIPGKCYFDEYFHSGGEDYDMDRRAYLSGYRCLGTNLSYVYHYWYSTKHPDTGEAKVKYDGGLFHKKWGEVDENGQIKEIPDIYGHIGKKEVPQNTIRED